MLIKYACSRPSSRKITRLQKSSRLYDVARPEYFYDWPQEESTNTASLWNMASTVSFASLITLPVWNINRLEEAIWESYARWFPLPADKTSNGFFFGCAWGHSVQFCARCVGPLAPPLVLVTLLRGRWAAVCSQSSITVSSGWGCRSRASSDAIYQPSDAVMRPAWIQSKNNRL